MGKEKIISCTLVILITIPLFCFGCTWTTQKTSKGLVIRCPKCAAFYSLKEVDKTFEWMRGELKELRRWSLVPTPWHSIFGFLVLGVKRQRRLRTGNFPCLFINSNTNEKDVINIYIFAPGLLPEPNDRFLGNTIYIFSSFW